MGQDQVSGGVGMYYLSQTRAQPWTEKYFPNPHKSCIIFNNIFYFNKTDWVLYHFQKEMYDIFIS